VGPPSVARSYTRAAAVASARASANVHRCAARRDGSVAEYNAAVKIKARVFHRLGEVLAATVKPRAGAGRPRKNGDIASPISNGLPEPITKKQSSRAQQLARAPWPEIERRIDAETERNQRAAALARRGPAPRTRTSGTSVNLPRPRRRVNRPGQRQAQPAPGAGAVDAADAHRQLPHRQRPEHDRLR
jgi:hypothetical protein